MKVLLVKNVFDDSQILLEMFKSLVKGLKSNTIDNYISLYFQYENDEDIIHVLNALETELMGPIHAYISMDLPEARLEKEIKIMIPIMEDLPLGIYTFKEALLKQKQLSNKKDIFSYITEGTGINEAFISEFADNNLNVSQASKAMFIHRNTLIYKMNKLKAISGFDISNFKDAYILYSLIEK